jgi:GT2 family glycosyltransferase
VDLTIIVINWNTKDDLRICLRSLDEHPCRFDTEVIVADNASEDGSCEMVKAEFRWAKVVAHPRNLGFCAGNNRGVPDEPGRYILFLNADTRVTPCALDRLLGFADTSPDAGIIGPKLLNRDGSLQYSCRRFPNLGAGFFRNTPLGRLFPKNRFAQDYLMSDWDHASVRDVDWVSGAALLIRREALKQIGGFDEGFFMYCEDVDLCYRAHELGWRVVYFPNSVIYHLIGRSSDQVPTRATYYFHTSMYRFYKKHYARITPFFIKPLILPGLIARASGQIVRYRWRHLKRSLHRRGRR